MYMRMHVPIYVYMVITCIYIYISAYILSAFQVSELYELWHVE